jgi:hypothetical protein
VPIERRPDHPLPQNYRPPNSVPVEVHTGDDWGKLAAQFRIDVPQLLKFNFNTTKPEEINYYLRVNVGCNQTTRDGRNWIFTTSTNPSRPRVIYVPAELRQQCGLQSCATVRLRVPYIRGTKNESCWHDCARMIYMYKRGADINPVADEYANADVRSGGPATYVKLIKELGFQKLDVPDPVTTEFLSGALMRCGPLWALGDWNWNKPYTPANPVGHIIVITGIDDDGTVYFNDPAHFRTGPDKSDIRWVNEHLGDSEGVSMLYLP